MALNENLKVVCFCYLFSHNFFNPYTFLHRDLLLKIQSSMSVRVTQIFSFKAFRFELLFQQAFDVASFNSHVIMVNRNNWEVEVPLTHAHSSSDECMITASFFFQCKLLGISPSPHCC